MEQSSISYSKMLNYNLKLIPNIGNVMPYQNVMEILFGREFKEIRGISPLELIHKKLIIDHSDDNKYLHQSKFKDFLLFISKKIKWDSTLCPVNFFDVFESLETLDIETPILEKYQKMFLVLNNFGTYLKEKDMIIFNIYWKHHFKGLVTSYQEEPFKLTLEFKRGVGNPLKLNLIEDEDGESLSLNNSESDQFEHLYNKWKEVLAMDKPDDFVINCLVNVTGSLDLSKFIFNSHQEKEKFIIDVEDLSMIINYKNAKKKEEYLELFKSIYKTEGIYLESEDSIKLNFEGFNKYLLNLEAKFLESFEDKEVINTLYFNVMDELVNSYKKLYLFFKTI